jgi:hypothetical protein
MKILPQENSPSSFPKSFPDKKGFNEAIQRYKRQKPLPRKDIILIGTESLTEKLSAELSSSPYIFRACPSFNLLLRSGLYQESEIFILTQPVHTAKAEDIGRVLSQRRQCKVKVVVWEESSAEELVTAIGKCIDELDLSDAKKFITEDVFSLSQNLISSSRTSDTVKKHIKEEASFVSLSKEEFKEHIAYKLNEHLESRPENILSEAIKIIKDRK